MTENIPPIINRIRELQPKSILDIGCGFGLYGVLCRQYLEVLNAPVQYGTRFVTIDAIEVYEPYITDLHRAVYDNISIGNALDILPNIKDNTYDLVLLLDVLEHFTIDEGRIILDNIRRISKDAIINVPYPPGPQGEVFGNKHEAHISAWDVSDLEPCEVMVKTDALIVKI